MVRGQQGKEKGYRSQKRKLSDSELATILSRRPPAPGTRTKGMDGEDKTFGNTAA